MTRLLVSVRSAAEAASAMLGGADLIDAKEPANGPLGPVSLDTCRAIAAEVAGRRPLTAALGDPPDEAAAERAASAFSAAGASFVKLGFAGIDEPRRVRQLIAAAARGGRVVAVAYADHARVRSIHPAALIGVAAAGGAAGILIDTADKNGPGLAALMRARQIRTWIERAHAAGLFVAVAGRLTREDVARVSEWGTDIVGVRGAACDGGRAGVVSAARVAALRRACAHVRIAVSATLAESGRVESV